VDTSAAPFNTSAAPSSPTSSQGSWVVDPDDGWDDSGSGSGSGSNNGNELGPSAVPPSPESPPPSREHHRRTPPSSSPLRSWAQVPMSPPAAEYPAMTTSMANSPPPSPGGSVRSLKSVGSASSGGSNSSRGAVAGEGLVALARDEDPTPDTTPPPPPPPLASNGMDISDSAAAAPTAVGSDSPAVLVPRSLPFDTFEALEAQGFSGAWGRAGAGSASAGQGCREVDDVGAAATDMDVSGFADPADEAFVMTAAPGMTAAEAVEAIAEAAELTGVTPTSVVLSRTTVSPSRMSSGRPSPSEGEEKATEGITFRQAHSSPAAAAAAAAARFRARAPLRNLSSSSTANTPAAGAAGVARVPERDSATVPPASGSSTYIPMDTDTAVGMGVDVDVDGTYDRLWRWTGFLTAAKMGVIPIIVCATVAALSTQSSSGDRGGRGGGGGSGGGGRGGGGGGGTRCSSRRRPHGGGGGGGCFPDVRIDRCVYGGMPMPYCVAPSVACA
ncbi:unnamed protein product, partial [Ectocarpus fasciculatus]